MTRWQQKAGALWAAWVRLTGKTPPNPTALKLVLAQAEHETNCGDAWDFSHNWGACNLRALNAAEREAFKAGALTPGMWLYPDGTYGLAHRADSVGTIRGDSDPNSGPFHVWFFAAPTDIDGAFYMLRAGVRGARTVLDDYTCTANAYAQALYVMCCYFGGFHAGARLRPTARGSQRRREGERARLLQRVEPHSPEHRCGLGRLDAAGGVEQARQRTVRRRRDRQPWR
jgi:hypothetical protein